MPHIDSRRRAMAAMEMRAEAKTWQSIADSLNFATAQGARTAVRRLRAKIAPTVEEQRAESAEELRVLREDLHDQRKAAKHAGDVENATKISREIRANLDTLAQLEGLNAIRRTEHVVTVQQNPEAIWDRLEGELRAVLPQQRQLPAVQREIIDAEVVNE